MKNMIKSFFALIMSVALITSCDDDDGVDVLNQTTVLEVAAQKAELSIFREAVLKAGLTTELATANGITVFAPSNDAFVALLNSNDDWSSLDDIPVTTLASVLKYHVLAQEVRASALSDSYVNTMAAGPNDEPLSLQVEVTGGVEFNGDAKPLETDLLADNGVIHIIDRVMMAPNVVGKALANDNFSILVQALSDSRLSTDLVALLNSDGPFTIFAPTNTAFQALLNSNDDWNSLSDIPAETLEAVLTYHVISGANVQSDQLVDDQSIPTANGDALTVELDGGPQVETTSDQTVMIEMTDIQSTNGVLHVINTVLLPD